MCIRDSHVPVREDAYGVAYVLEGAVGIGTQPQQLNEGQVAVLGPGDTVQLHGYVAPDERSWLLLMLAL